MEIIDQYLDGIERLFQRIKTEERENIDKAAEVLADSIALGRLIHVFGTGGHSYICAEEVFYRAGGLVPINSMLDPGVSLAFGAVRTTLMERTPGYAKAVLDYYGVKKGDVIIIANVNGINSATIDAALEAKARGLTVIGITSSDFAKSIPPGIPARHPSNKNLHEVVDIVADVHVPPGDAVVEIPGFELRVGASSTVVMAFMLNVIMATAVKKLKDRGIDPPVWKSANIPGGDEANRKYIENYFGKIKHL